MNESNPVSPELERIADKTRDLVRAHFDKRYRGENRSEDKIYEIILSVLKEQHDQVQLLTVCRDHWKTSFEHDRKNTIKMYLCEASRLCLKPGQSYRFKLDPDCPKCRDLSALALQVEKEKHPLDEATCFCGQPMDGHDYSHTPKQLGDGPEPQGELANEDEGRNAPCVYFMTAEELTKWASEIDPCPEQVAAINEINRRLAAFDLILNHVDTEQHTDDGECYECGKICCPFGEPLHFHHDGCPSCVSYVYGQKSLPAYGVPPLQPTSSTQPTEGRASAEGDLDKNLTTLRSDARGELLNKGWSEHDVLRVIPAGEKCVPNIDTQRVEGPELGEDDFV